MSLFCLFRGCKREAVCRCRRCGRETHDWQRVGKHVLLSELQGCTREGKMR